MLLDSFNSDYLRGQIPKEMNMKQRYSDSTVYFNELVNTSREFYIDYLRKFIALDKKTRILEIGCGQGGNLLPFAEIGCKVTGVDINTNDAKSHFDSRKQEATFLCIDFFQLDSTEKYDLVLVHDVIEHIEQKTAFINRASQFVKEDGLIFWRFPAWQMPFGGHQQTCQSKFLSSLPFIHLLPEKLYRFILKAFGESQRHINELISIKHCATPIERFENELKRTNLAVVDRTLWFINPHYKQKFNLKPRLLYGFLSRIRYVRNFFCTSCYYLTKQESGKPL